MINFTPFFSSIFCRLSSSSSTVCRIKFSAVSLIRLVFDLIRNVNCIQVSNGFTFDVNGNFWCGGWRADGHNRLLETKWLLFIKWRSKPNFHQKSRNFLYDVSHRALTCWQLHHFKSVGLRCGGAQVTISQVDVATDELYAIRILIIIIFTANIVVQISAVIKCNSSVRGTEKVIRNDTAKMVNAGASPSPSPFSDESRWTSQGENFRCREWSNGITNFPCSVDSMCNAFNWMKAMDWERYGVCAKCRSDFSHSTLQMQFYDFKSRTTCKRIYTYFMDFIYLLFVLDDTLALESPREINARNCEELFSSKWKWWIP